MRSLGTHVELVRELGLDPHIRRPNDGSLVRAARDIAVGTAIGFAFFLATRLLLGGVLR